MLLTPLPSQGRGPTLDAVAAAMERPMMEMPDAAWILPEERGVLAVDGPDSRDFLQGLVSNDVQRVAADRAIYAALLPAPGRYLHDFFIAAQGDSLLPDVADPRPAPPKPPLKPEAH